MPLALASPLYTLRIGEKRLRYKMRLHQIQSPKSPTAILAIIRVYEATMSENETVCWEELLPAEFEARLKAFPVVYLPLGLCEPHGHIAPFGLDTIKARYLCEQAARRFGGIVAPAMAYQIHETGYHAPWLRR